MKKKYILITLLLICLTVLSACQSEDARMVDDSIRALALEEISLDTWESIAEIETLIAELSEKEYASLESVDSYTAIVEEYTALEEEAISKIETLISEIPPIEEISLSSDSAIESAAFAFNKTTPAVQNKISNRSLLEDAQVKIEELKKAAWVPCDACGGDGIQSCSRCHGTGSRKVPYTTPNGKTWQVHQQCATTQSCSKCKGDGGIYIE